MKHPEFTSAHDQLQIMLRESGIDVAAKPHFGERPRDVLIRGENNRRHITGQERHFQPQSGASGTHGVFLADALDAVMRGDIYYIFRERDVLQASGFGVWTPYDCAHNEESRALLNRFATKKGVDLKTISGGIEAETELFKSLAVYQPQSGIATIPKPLPVDRAISIFVKESVLRELAGRINKPLEDKIVRF